MSITLVLLPGLDGTGLLFQPLLAALPASIKPIVMAYPGDRHLSYEELLPIVLNALPRSGWFILLGESFSGPLAVMAAASRPAGLVGLILCASFVTPPWPCVRPAISVCARALPFRLYFPFKRIKAQFGGVATSAYRNSLAEMCRIVEPDVIAARVRMVFGVDVREALRSCDVPMLYLCGTRDVVVPKRNLRIVQTIQTTIQVQAFAASHMVLQQRPVEVARAISAFASSLNSSTGDAANA
jgi:pimeloyl-[acyl-carrier protein] methyl ester esterase